MKVVLTAAALADLERIGDFIAQDNPVRARTFVAELLGKARDLADPPNGFAVVPRYERLGIRRRLRGDYAIFYRIEGERIVVIHVLHGARDYEAILFGGEGG